MNSNENTLDLLYLKLTLCSFLNQTYYSSPLDKRSFEFKDFMFPVSLLLLNFGDFAFDYLTGRIIFRKES